VERAIKADDSFSVLKYSTGRATKFVRPGHPHPERSQSGVREAAVAEKALPAGSVQRSLSKAALALKTGVSGWGDCVQKHTRSLHHKHPVSPITDTHPVVRDTDNRIAASRPVPVSEDSHRSPHTIPFWNAL